VSGENGDAARILPELTLANEFYWTSGADGQLRFQQCTACSALIHPPAPVCRTCRSAESVVTAVSGLGRLIGFTVNHRMRLPGLEPPYVVGHVAIEEDDRVRLTTRIVDAEPDELRLGQRVRVVFEPVEDVYLPLFTPTGEPGGSELPRDEIVPEDMRDDEILINQWLADDLRIGPGADIALAYFLADAGAQLVEQTNHFRVRAVVPMILPYADRSLMPEFPFPAALARKVKAGRLQ